jgi:hypothetical protein
MTPRCLILSFCACVCLLASPARAAHVPVGPAACSADAAGDASVWRVDWVAAGTGAPAGELGPLRLSLLTAGFDAAVGGQATAATRPRAVEYSDAYQVRRKIHKYASIATLPLFVSQAIVGQKLYNGTGSESLRGVHSALAVSTAVLFGVNSVTGVWNLWEARNDPAGRTRRTVHGVLMLVADAGFVATGMLAPSHEFDEHDGQVHGGGGNASTHRTVAYTSMAIATVSYLMMLVTR